jgi:hypothetical protein
MIDESAQVVRRYIRPPKYSHAWLEAVGYGIIFQLKRAKFTRVYCIIDVL